MTTAAPLTRYGAHWGARFASEPATAEDLHHVRGHDPISSLIWCWEMFPILLETTN